MALVSTHPTGTPKGAPPAADAPHAAVLGNYHHLKPLHETLLSETPYFAISALVRFTPADNIALIQRHVIRYHETTLGQLFCDRSAHDVITMLERECAEAGVRLIV